jgi:hypothetical protein
MQRRSAFVRQTVAAPPSALPQPAQNFAPATVLPSPPPQCPWWPIMIRIQCTRGNSWRPSWQERKGIERRISGVRAKASARPRWSALGNRGTDGRLRLSQRGYQVTRYEARGLSRREARASPGRAEFCFGHFPAGNTSEARPARSAEEIFTMLTRASSSRKKRYSSPRSSAPKRKGRSSRQCASRTSSR